MNCKPGDLAILMKDGQGGKSNAIGLVVEVLEPSDCHGGPGWVVKMPGKRRVVGEGISIITDKFRAPDAWLRPVSGLPITDDVTDEVTA